MFNPHILILTSSRKQLLKSWLAIPVVLLVYALLVSGTDKYSIQFIVFKLELICYAEAVNCNNNNPLGTNEIHVIPAEQGADPAGIHPDPNSLPPNAVASIEQQPGSDQIQ